MFSRSGEKHFSEIHKCLNESILFCIGLAYTLEAGWVNSGWQGGKGEISVVPQNKKLGAPSKVIYWCDHSGSFQAMGDFLLFPYLVDLLPSPPPGLLVLSTFSWSFSLSFYSCVNSLWKCFFS